MAPALPVDLTRYFTPQDFARGAAWARWCQFTNAASLLIDLTILFLATFGATGRRLWSQLEAWSERRPAGALNGILGDDWLAGALFLVAVTVARNAAMFPLILGRGYFAAHAYRISRESLGMFLRHEAIAWTVAVGVNAILGATLGGLRRRWPRRWWLAVGVAASVALVGDTVIEPLWANVDFKVHSLPQGPLRQRLQSFLAAHHAHMGDIMVVDTSAYGTPANAFVSGLGPTRRLILTDTLLKFGDQAVLGAVAHEVGHRREQRLPMRLAMAIAGLLLFLWFVEQALRFALRRGARSEAHAFPFVRAMSLILVMVLSPVHAALGRAEEREADAVELSSRRDYDDYIAEQVRLVRANALDPSPPLLLRLLSDHPTPAERISRAIWWKAHFGQESRGNG